VVWLCCPGTGAQRAVTAAIAPSDAVPADAVALCAPMRDRWAAGCNGVTLHLVGAARQNQGTSMSPADDRQRLWDLIKDIRFAMFTTRHPNSGDLHARPMTTQNGRLDEDDRLWFFMSRRGDSFADLEVEPSVNVCYAAPDRDSYVSVTGTASVSEDIGKARALWSKANEAWFPHGVDDPDVALIEVRIDHAHYWNVQENRLTQFFKMAKAAVTGKAVADTADSGEVRLNDS
jgi:general stress protein 26